MEEGEACERKRKKHVIMICCPRISHFSQGLELLRQLRVAGHLPTSLPGVALDPYPGTHDVRCTSPSIHHVLQDLVRPSIWFFSMQGPDGEDVSITEIA